MLNKYSIIDLQNVVKIKSEHNLCFDKILEYIEIIKSYETDSEVYVCEWIDQIKITSEDINEAFLQEEVLAPHLKIGNIQTYNYAKVPKVI